MLTSEKRQMTNAVMRISLMNTENMFGEKDTMRLIRVFMVAVWQCCVLTCSFFSSQMTICRRWFEAQFEKLNQRRAVEYADI